MAGGDRSTADSVLLAELLAGRTVVDAAETAGMSERTARRRLADDAFRAQLDDGRRELVTAVVARLAGGASKAVSTLLELVDEPTPPSVRLNAAVKLLERLETFGEAADLARRLQQIEELLEQRLDRPRAVA